MTRSFVALVLAFFCADARAVVPRFVGSPVVGNPSFDGVVNTMMYTVTVTVDGTASDADHTAMVAFASEDDYVGCGNATPWKWSHAESFDTTDTRSWTLYNFQPGTKYYYRARLGGGATTRSRCGVLETVAAPTPTIPDELGYLNIRYTKSGDPFDTKYLLVETDDCGGSGTRRGSDYLVVLDPVTEAIVWYLDVAASAGLADGSAIDGFRYYGGATAAEDAILASVEHQYVYEWGFDGTTLNSYDFGNAACEGVGAEGPCLHHDVAKSPLTGNTYVLGGGLSTNTSTDTVWETNCGTDARFVDDGYHVLDDTFTETGELYMMADAAYDPAVNPGPDGARLAARPSGCSSAIWDRLVDSPDGLIDWIHVNSVVPWTVGTDEVVDVSLKEWNQVVRFDAATGALLWRLSARRADSDWGALSMGAGVVGPATFADQHDVHAIGDDTLLMFDNQGDTTGARALQIRLNDTRPRTAVIEKSWAVVNGSGSPLRCATEGTAELVPGSDHAFVMCAGITVAVELDDPTGNSGNPPPLTISLPDGDPDEFCAVGGPDARSSISGWKRAFPIERVGEF